jgi:hypothetical protein
MDAIDKLLAELKLDQQAQPANSQLERSQQGQTSSQTSLDDLLEAISDQTKQTVQKRLSEHASFAHQDESLSLPINYDVLDTLTIADPKSIASSQYVGVPAKAQSLEADLLSQLSHQYQERDHREALQQQQERQDAERRQQQVQQAQQRRLDALKAKRRAELTQSARKWLKRLSPKTSEGQWFEEFACGYESHLEAAIDYLEALQEVNQE